MIKKVPAVALASVLMLASGAAFAAEVLPNGPEPYSAPDPVYTPHKIESTVTMKTQTYHPSLTANESAPESGHMSKSD